MLRRTKIALVMVQPAGAESKGGLDTTTAARPESLLAVEKRPESLSGTIIREWHPQSKIPGRLARRKTLTRFLLWRGPLVPTAPLNSSIGAGWITPASLRKRHQIGAAALHTEDRDRLLDCWRHLLDSGEAGEIEARLRRYDGDYRWFLFRVEPVRDNRGGILKWYGANTDIEDRKRAEALLAAEKRTLEMIANGASLVDILERLC